MSFIAKNPLTMPKTNNIPDVPNGTRGLVAKEDGWYDVDPNKKTKRIATIDDINGDSSSSMIHIILDGEDISDIYKDYTTSGIYFFTIEDGDAFSVHTLKVWWEFETLYQELNNSLRRIFEYDEWSEWKTFNVDFTPDERKKVAKIDGVISELNNKASMEDVCEYVDEQTEIIKTDVEGLQKQLNEEAHFKGYMSTNAKIQALAATPNDFAYSAESGTKWIYDEVNGWQDSNTPVPDQLTPASESTPLINGTASAGTENAYARGDHRHPTDTTRASIAQLNDLSNRVDGTELDITSIVADLIKIENSIGNIDSALDELHNYAQGLIGGDS